MARGIYTNVIAKADAAGLLSALSNVQVTVRLTSNGSIATIYRARTGATQGPTPGSGATGTNPFTTGASGTAEFWLDAGEYDIQVHDLQAPPRVADYTLGFQCVPAAAAGIPSALVAADAGLQLGAFSAAIMRQYVPLGTVIEWWRPSSSFDAGGGAGNPPPGWEICDGRSIAEANHDFGAIGAVALPDLRNAFVLGADISKAHGASATANSNSATAGPGITGAGGAHSINMTLPSHKHGVGTLTTAAAGSHHHGTITGADDRNHTHAYTFTQTYDLNAQGGLVQAVNADYIGTQTGGESTNHWHSISSDGSHGHTMQGEIGNTASSSGDSSYNAGAQDLRPRYVGLLKLMKVKRS